METTQWHRRLAEAKLWTKSNFKIVAFVSIGALATMPLWIFPGAQAAEADVLQTVNIQTDTAGGITAIVGDVFIMSSGSVNPTSTEHDPAKTAKDLPVRIRTSYRTADKSGSDLKDLDGYNGSLTIDITVENTTVVPKEIAYDSAGTSKKTSALVGVPLTVMASTVVDTSPYSVVTAGDEPDAVTNGVLSKNEDGKAVIQWATILAPPQSTPSTHLRLVANVQDFTVPIINVAVQRGFVTDPSAQGIVGSAAGGATASEAALSAATIEVINDVNTNLAKASEIVTKVKNDLQTSSQTLGTTSLRDLTSSSQTLSSSMQMTGANIQALSETLGSALNASESNTVSLLKGSINAVAASFGDTTQEIVVPKVNGQGCDVTFEGQDGTTQSGAAGQSDASTQPEKPKGPESVYGGVARLSGYLNAYANSTESCRQAIGQQMLTSIGPDDPTDESCKDSESVTCSLHRLSSEIATINTSLSRTSQERLAVLQPSIFNRVQAGGKTLSELVDSATSNAARLTIDGDDHHVALASLTDNLNALEVMLSDIDTGLSDARTRIQSAQDANGRMSHRLDDLKTDICALQSDAPAAPPPAGTPPNAGGAGTPNPAPNNQAELDKAMAHLSDVSCARNGEAPRPLDADPSGARLPDELAQQAADLVAANQILNPAEPNSVGALIAAMQQTVTDSKNELDALKSGIGTSVRNASTTTAKIEGLKTQLVNLQTAVSQFNTELQDLRGVHENGINDLVGAIQQSLGAIDDRTDDAVDGEVRRVTQTSQSAVAQVGRLVSKAGEGARQQADNATGLTRTLLDEQKKQLTTTRSETESALEAAKEKTIESVGAATSSATRDVESARALLSADLARLLADLGTPTQNGSGFLGTVNTSAALTSNATYQLALAQQQNEAYVNIRTGDVTGLLLEQSQVKAGLEALADAKPFQMPDTKDKVTTVYSYTVGGQK